MPKAITPESRNKVLKAIIEINSKKKYTKKPITEGFLLSEGFDSLDVVELCMLLEQKYKIAIVDEEVEHWKQVSDVIDSVCKRIS